MTSPRLDFVIGGVQKCGTSALAAYLARHPKVRLPEHKEAHVFDRPDFCDTWTPPDVDALYEGCWQSAPAPVDALHGDATPFYVYDARLIARIARYNPAMKWILLLRDPTERTVSHYYMECARNREQRALPIALLSEPLRLRRHRDAIHQGSPLATFSYVSRSRYVGQLDQLFRHFPRHQVLLLRTGDLRDSPETTVARTCDFLGIDRPPQGASYPRVFEGHYRPDRHRFTRWLLRLYFRRDLRELRRRYGIDLS